MVKICKRNQSNSSVNGRILNLRESWYMHPQNLLRGFISSISWYFINYILFFLASRFLLKVVPKGCSKALSGANIFLGVISLWRLQKNWKIRAPLRDICNHLILVWLSRNQFSDDFTSRKKKWPRIRRCSFFFFFFIFETRVK